MDKFINYIKKNMVFVGLLSVLLFITVAGTIYIVWNKQSEPPVENNNPPAPQPEPDPVVEEKALTITSFEGSYGKDGQVHFSWAIDAGTQTIKSVQLLYKGTALPGEMKTLTSYAYAQSLYQFDTGDNLFTLRVLTEKGETITKEVNVNINMAYALSMSSELVEDGVLVKLSYEYDGNNPVDVPRIFVLNNTSAQPFTYDYQTTEHTQKGSMVQAVTIYKIGTKDVAAGTYNVKIRWTFDGLNISRDYPLEIVK